MHDIQKDILALAKKENIGGYGLRTIGKKVGVSHPQKVKWHINKLIKDGYLVRSATGELVVSDGRKRKDKLSRIPILGLANCGEPLSYADDSTLDYLPLSPGMIKVPKKARLFAVIAKGDSMNKAGINGKCIEEGDYIIANSEYGEIKNGDYVVASIEGLASVKRFYRSKEQNYISLASESTRSRPPILIHEKDGELFQVHGRVVDVISIGQQ